MTRTARKPGPPATRPQPPKLSIREKVYHHLRSRMRQGEVGLADRLVDHEIAASLSVSRMPVREALLQLKHEGLLEGTSRGFVLRRFTPTDIAQMFEVRLLLEPPAAASACESATLEGLAIMSQATEASIKAHESNDIIGYMEANDLFRTTWISQVPNRHLASMITRLADHVEAVRLATLRNPKFREWSLTSTRKITEAFMDKDVEAVQESVRFNLRKAVAAYYATQDSLIEQQNNSA
ncbi:GntR family transcriptional regulator [Pusillimonas noertemannii]|uniref:GntR family transcriptional regulator n=1 Tax=Pusillimonas noertemannii TaxID=305977 RepID=A0A2U1CNE3_9BURK|nr:GntR family transcriptional regulator [Pusillimonas noertemannii]NYT68450.1 GntR family transcriptional regulator [Pusillimonas noertemannii]PVY62533.1 GntR family transcriptional regulator [Pusillimonas noertemannii]TFL10515.1 GntR family transcriptional regulator [Pusillimonas noertemannii]